MSPSRVRVRAPTNVIAACTDAGIHDHVSGLRDGYESRAGERGGRMSGGQRQRIAIARAILRRPDLLILDEATSALDPATEAEVNATLRLVARGRTTVSATHRLASITDADLIVVLDGGRVAEQGTHDVLLSAGGHYRALWDKQSSIVLETTRHYTIDPAALCDVELLRSLDDDQRGEVADLLTGEQHPPGGVVFSQGDRGDALYIVARGRIEILQDGKRIRVLEEGDHFGENRPWSAPGSGPREHERSPRRSSCGWAADRSRSCSTATRGCAPPSRPAFAAAWRSTRGADRWRRD
jgi:ATP-binding cassette subfamily B protein